jgi:hypothetical protein
MLGDDAKIEASDSPFKLIFDMFDNIVVPSSCAPIIDFIIAFCKFPDNSTMVKFIDQQGWTELIHVTTISLDEIMEFHTVKDGFLYETKPMLVHICMFKCFLLYYKRQTCELCSTLLEDNVMYTFDRVRFEEYCGLDEYSADLVGGGESIPQIKGSDDSYLALGAMTVQEFCRGVKRDTTHDEDLKDDKYFNLWNRGFVVTAHMHRIHLVLYETYIPKNNVDFAVFMESPTFMYAVLKDHLKSEKGKLFVSQYEFKRDAQSIYRD